MGLNILATQTNGVEETYASIDRIKDYSFNNSIVVRVKTYISEAGKKENEFQPIEYRMITIERVDLTTVLQNTNADLKSVIYAIISEGMKIKENCPVHLGGFKYVSDNIEENQEPLDLSNIDVFLPEE